MNYEFANLELHDKVGLQRERPPPQTNTLSIVPSQSDIRGKLIVNLEARPQLF